MPAIPEVGGAAALKTLVAGDTTLLTVLKAEDFRTPFCSAALRNIGDKLELDSRARVEHNAQVFRLTDWLQDRLMVARFYVSGSYGRRVTVGQPPQIDLVIFLRNSSTLPPYNKTQVDLLPRLHAAISTEFRSMVDVTVHPLLHPGCTLPEDASGIGGTCAFKKSSSNRSRRNSLTTGKNRVTFCGGRRGSINSVVAVPPRHECAANHIFISMGTVEFRIFMAPALGRNSEDQRQATYRHMESVFAAAGGGAEGLHALAGWHPALLERPSEVIAHAPSEVQAFIRICQLWMRNQKIDSFDRYGVEALAYGVARATRGPRTEEEAAMSSGRVRHRFDEKRHPAQLPLDLGEAFRRFLLCCIDLIRVNQMFEIESPCSYTSPWASGEPVLTDRFNPYKNLLDTLTAEDAALLSAAAREKLALISDSSTKNPVSLAAVFQPARSVASRGRTTSTWFRRLLTLLFVLLAASAAIYFLPPRGLVVRQDLLLPQLHGKWQSAQTIAKRGFALSRETAQQWGPKFNQVYNSVKSFT